MAALGGSGEDQKLRTPVTRVGFLARRRQQVVTGLMEMMRPAAVGPAGRDRADAQVLVDGEDDRRRGRPGLEVDRQHGAEADQPAGHADIAVIEAEGRPEGRAFGARLVEGGVIEQAVGDQKEHRDDAGNGIEVAERHHRRWRWRR